MKLIKIEDNNQYYKALAICANAQKETKMNYEDIYLKEDDIIEIRKFYNNMYMDELVKHPEYLMFELGIENNVDIAELNNIDYDIFFEKFYFDGESIYEHPYIPNFKYNTYTYDILQYLKTTRLNNPIIEPFRPMFDKDSITLFLKNVDKKQSVIIDWNKRWSIATTLNIFKDWKHQATDKDFDKLMRPLINKIKKYKLTPVRFKMHFTTTILYNTALYLKNKKETQQLSLLKNNIESNNKPFDNLLINKIQDYLTQYGQNSVYYPTLTALLIALDNQKFGIEIFDWNYDDIDDWNCMSRFYYNDNIYEKINFHAFCDHEQNPKFSKYIFNNTLLYDEHYVRKNFIHIEREIHLALSQITNDYEQYGIYSVLKPIEQINKKPIIYTSNNINKQCPNCNLSFNNTNYKGSYDVYYCSDKCKLSALELEQLLSL